MDFLTPDPERRGEPPWYGASGGEAAGEADSRPYGDGFRHGDPGPLTDELPAERSAGWYGASAATAPVGHGAGGATPADGYGASGTTPVDGYGTGAATPAEGYGALGAAPGDGYGALGAAPGDGYGTGGATPADGRLGDGEVLESGPERPQGGVDWMARDLRRWWRRSATPWRRRATAAAAALAAAGVLVALRAGAPTVPVEEEAVAAEAASAPVIIYGRARLQPPPFDRLPGRTPIPTPSPVGRPAEAVRGALPATGAIGEEAARDASQLVLGRYCRYPRGYQVLLEPKRSWHEVTAIVLHRTYVGPRRLTTLQLRWTGRAYSWLGWPTELARCA